MLSPDRQAKDQKTTDDNGNTTTTSTSSGSGSGSGSSSNYQASLEKLDTQIESVQDFWRYNNNTPVEQIKMRESIYLFKSGFRPIWEDRRNVQGGSWTFRVPKANGPEFWTRVQLLAIGEKLQEALEQGISPFPPFFLASLLLLLSRPHLLTPPFPQPQATRSAGWDSRCGSART